jgi:hypothetical protein
LVLEAVPVLLEAGRAADARRLLDHPVPGGDGPPDSGRFRLLRARTALALGRPARARAYFDAGFVVDDLREGDETLSDTWWEIAEALAAAGGTGGNGAAGPAAGPGGGADRARVRREHPLPAAYDFRMRPAEREPN